MDILIGRSPVDKPRVRVKRHNQGVYCDGFGRKSQQPSFVRFAEIKKSRQYNTQSLSARGVRTSFFVTEDSRRYISPQQSVRAINHEMYVDTRKRMDSVGVRYEVQRGLVFVLEERARGDFDRLWDRIFALRKMYKWNLSPIRMWQFSMVGAMLFGMITMSAIYKNLGQSVQASHDTQSRAHALDPVTALIIEGGTEAIVEEPSEVKKFEEGDLIGELPLAADKDLRTEDQKAFEVRATEMVAGYPIEQMLPYIFKQDREVAMYLIAIAKQESAWGKRKPVLNGEDCYNYWGYRAKRERMGSGGHTCFDSRQDAVETVAKRIHSLIYEYGRTEPAELIVWKCGYSCAGHSKAGVDRWISTVTMYRNALKNDE